MIKALTDIDSLMLFIELAFVNFAITVSMNRSGLPAGRLIYKLIRDGEISISKSTCSEAYRLLEVITPWEYATFEIILFFTTNHTYKIPISAATEIGILYVCALFR